MDEKIKELVAQMIDAEDVARIVAEFVVKNYSQDYNEDHTGISAEDFPDEDTITEILIPFITYRF
jgi:hypothetical protein